MRRVDEPMTTSKLVAAQRVHRRYKPASTEVATLSVSLLARRRGECLFRLRGTAENSGVMQELRDLLNRERAAS